MKRVSLSKSQQEVLEDALIHYGSVVTTADLAELIPVQGAAQKRRFVKQMADAGWLVRIKRGLYQIADLSSLGMLTLSRYTIAQLLVEDSYVSFEAALQFHGMYDQLPGTVISVAGKQYPMVMLEGIEYQFIKDGGQILFRLGREHHGRPDEQDRHGGEGAD